MDMVATDECDPRTPVRENTDADQSDLANVTLRENASRNLASPRHRDHRHRHSPQRGYRHTSPEPATRPDLTNRGSRRAGNLVSTPPFRTRSSVSRARPDYKIVLSEIVLTRMV